MKMKKQKVFVAIDIPENLKDIIENYLEPFYKSELVRVTERNNWHITVVFCGYLDDKNLERLKESARDVASRTKKFEFSPEKIFFSPPKRPRMVWLAFKHSPEFSSLAKELSDFSQDRREQIPHLTLVRFKEFHYPNLKKLLPENGIDLKDEAESFMVESINIMESHLSPKGPRYELLERINLL